MFAFLAFTAFSCNDDGEENLQMPTSSLMADNQMLPQDLVMVKSITLNEEGWVVLHKNNGSGPIVPAIISKSKFLGAGTSPNVMIEFKEGVTLADGEKFG